MGSIPKWDPAKCLLIMLRVRNEALTWSGCVGNQHLASNEGLLLFITRARLDQSPPAGATAKGASYQRQGFHFGRQSCFSLTDAKDPRKSLHSPKGVCSLLKYIPNTFFTSSNIYFLCNYCGEIILFASSLINRGIFVK